MVLTLSSVFAGVTGPADIEQITTLHTDRFIMDGGDLPERHLWATAEQDSGGKWHVYGHKIYNTIPGDIKVAPEKHCLTKDPIKLENALARLRRFESEQLQKNKPVVGLRVKRGFFPPPNLRGSTHITRVEKALSSDQSGKKGARRKTPTAIV